MSPAQMATWTSVLAQTNVTPANWYLHKWQQGTCRYTNFSRFTFMAGVSPGFLAALLTGYPAFYRISCILLRQSPSYLDCYLEGPLLNFSDNSLHNGRRNLRDFLCWKKTKVLLVMHLKLCLRLIIMKILLFMKWKHVFFCKAIIFFC